MDESTINGIREIGRKAKDREMQSGLEYMIACHEKRGGHWFSDENMRFFKTRIESALVEGVFFITSEKPPRGERRYSIRRFSKDASDVSTVGEFLAFSSLGAAEAALEVAAEVYTFPGY